MPRIKSPHRWSSSKRAALWGIYGATCDCFFHRWAKRRRKA